MSRIERVEELIKQEIAKVIQRKIDPSKIGFISILSVSIAKDLANAKVFYCQIGSSEEKKKTENNLKKAAKFIKGEIGRVVHLKTIPNLRFIFDDSIERGNIILEKINKISSKDHVH